MRKTFSTCYRTIAVFLLVNMSLQLLLPSIAYALTAGPNSPEFSSFTPVATTDMVNIFTGDFSYNLPVVDIPGADGGGYSMSLAYNSGNSSEQEASWVGFGWSLNPGVINRNVRGYPDDYKNVKVDYYNKVRPNWSTSMTYMNGIEAFSADVPLSYNKSLRFNNYSGYYPSTGIGIGFKGMASLNMNLDANGATFSGDINPIAILNGATKVKNGADRHSSSYFTKELNIISSPFKRALSSVYGAVTFSEAIRPTSYTPYSGFGFNWSTSIQINAFVPVGLEVGHSGNFNMQFNESYLRSETVSGYKFSNSAEGLMDYYTEKGSAFDKRDHFIGMPFSNYDVFSVSGEGVSGGFRMFNEGVGQFRPPNSESSMGVGQVGFEVMVGTNIGIGLDFGLGSQNTSIDDWGQANNALFGSKNIYRFSNDLGGSIAYTQNNEIETGRVDLLNRAWGARRAIPTIPGDNNYQLQQNKGSSSFIQDLNLSSLAIPVPNNLQNHAYVTGGFEIFNEQGMRYKYGLPAFVKNETNMNVDITQKHELHSRYLAFRDFKLKDTPGGYSIEDELDKQNYRTIVGEIRKEPYVANHLLTEITTPDYIDLGGDGPSYDDFGGWTKFEYRKIYGEGQSEWYRYRTPYRGLIFQQNSISSLKDDVGSVITGQKEVHYLKTIETKTHIAYFVTNNSDFGTNELKGSKIIRPDGRGALPLDDNGDPSAVLPGAGNLDKSQTSLEYLEKIVIVPKNRDGSIDVNRTPLKVVRFDYDWSLVPNVANNSNSTYNYLSDASHNVQANSGKLTLKKVWFEYNGTVSARISPYEFNYTYKHSSLVPVEKELFHEYDHLSELAQNPSYSPHLIDPWGNLSPNIKERQEKGIPWIDQSAYYSNKSLDFDPAAWQLKSIKLPSGGEILIQYEEKEYAFVQNRPAMAMASLAGNKVLEDNYNSTTYNINVADLGANPKDFAEVGKLRQIIEDHFYGNGIANDATKKIYFKYLYALRGGNPSLGNCKSEFITGYANIRGIRVHGEANGDYSLAIDIGGENSGEGEFAEVPRKACYDFAVNQRQGKLENDECVEPFYEAPYDILATIAADFNQKKGLDNKLVKFPLAVATMAKMAGDPRVSNYKTYDKETVCLELSASQSFLKLPMYKAKKGGGIRVKRLLMYDEGIETGDPVVYGTEYFYKLNDGITSSGVATTEPSAAREENPLVSFLPKKDQSTFSRLTAGQDKEQTEGPLGETLLPAPSIGYSRVVIQNIHTGKTGTGFTVHEFYTAKDYPFDKFYDDQAVAEDGESTSKFDVSGPGVERTSLSDNKEVDFMYLPAGLFNYETNKIWLAQGFRFIINSMHGQVEKISSFGGEYAGKEDKNNYLVSMQEFTYYKPGEKIKLLKWDSENGQILESMEMPGKEMDVAMESKRLKDVTIDFSIEIDLSVTTFFFPPIFVGVYPSFSHSDKLIATHATTKVLRYPTILKNVTSYQDGVYNVQENVAFDASTGKPLLVRTEDGYNKVALGPNMEKQNGNIYSLTIPAHWMYPGMGQKADQANPDSFTNQLIAKAAGFVTYGKEPNSAWFASSELSNVLSASVQTYKKDWLSSWQDPGIKSLYEIDGTDEAKLQSKYRSAATYVYKVDDKQNVSDKIYNSGYNSIPNKFDWNIPADDEQADLAWLKTSTVQKYSPHGQVLEERNVLNIPSAALYGYKQQVPIMVAQNAEYGSIYFEDFEYLESSNVNTSIAHSGTSSGIATKGMTLVSNILVSDKVKKEGGLIKLWLHYSETEPSKIITTSVNGNAVDLEKVSTTGLWTLYSGIINSTNLPEIGSELNILLENLHSDDGQILIDDIRFQPKDALATCYVYDPDNLKLLTQFDDQHFGLFYQYNDEGKLVRKLIETERGLKTIEETQYNIPSKPRASL